MQVQIAFPHFLEFAINSLLDSSVALPHIDPSELDAITRQKGGIGTGVYCDVRTGFDELFRSEKWGLNDNLRYYGTTR
jgi:hypothetical protein